RAHQRATVPCQWIGWACPSCAAPCPDRANANLGRKESGPEQHGAIEQQPGSAAEELPQDAIKWGHHQRTDDRTERRTEPAYDAEKRELHRHIDREHATI